METFSYKDSIIGAVESMIGGRNENQDSYGSAATPHGMLVVVCDGMGGGPAGKTASTLATQAIIDYVSGAPADKNPVDIMLEAGKAANEAVLGAVEKDPSLRGMGTTCVCVLLTGEVAYIMHVGDSRCYHIFDESIQQITKDHTVIRRLIERGEITEEESRTHPRRNSITRAVGAAREITPDYFEIDLEQGHCLLLCSDGLHSYGDDAEIAGIIVNNPIQKCCELLIDYALANGGRDNTTVALIQC